MTVQPSISGVASPGPKVGTLLGIGLSWMVMYGPTYAALNDVVWSVVGQGHGPVMLGLAVWLAHLRWGALTQLQTSAAPVPGTALLVLASAMYAIGRSQDVFMFDVSSQIPMLMGLLLIYRGWAAVKLMWFPLFFILFVVPLPGFVVDSVTGPLKAAVSYVAEQVLYHLHYPVGRSGVTLIIGPYQLMVADACAGLNSIFALEAVGVFYISMMAHGDRLRNILLAALILPITFASNVIRVISLVLITYYFGDEVGQGFVHSFAGILLFILATLFMIMIDSVLGAILKSPQRQTSVEHTA